MSLGTVGLKGDHSRINVLRCGCGIDVVDDRLAVQPDLDVGSDRADSEVVPLKLLADGVVLVAFIEPGFVMQADILLGRAPADVDLVAPLPAFAGSVA